MVKQFFSRQFLLFLLTGGVAAAVNFGSRIVYSLWVPYTAAIVIAYLTGMVTAFILAKVFVFKESNQSTGKSALFFTLINGLAVLQTLAVSMVLAYYLLPYLSVTWHTKELAHLAGVMVPVFTSYLGHKRWSFQ